MSNIDVTGAIPKRLVFSQGRWCLEVMRWHAIDRDVFNPISSFISGPDTTLSYLQDLGTAPAILAQARDIVAGQADAGTTYELNDEQWVLQTQFADVPSYAPGPAPQASNEMKAVLEHLQGMDERLAFLERQLAGKVPGNDATPSVRPVPDEEVPHSSAG